MTDSGTAQGAVLSPLFGNVHLHDVLDPWFEQEVKSRLRGRLNLVRYVDDFISDFEVEEDASRVSEVPPAGSRATDCPCAREIRDFFA